jgi:hypothetical protein
MASRHGAKVVLESPPEEKEEGEEEEEAHGLCCELHLGGDR